MTKQADTKSVYPQVGFRTDTKSVPNGETADYYFFHI